MTRGSALVVFVRLAIVFAFVFVCLLVLALSFKIASLNLRLNFAINSFLALASFVRSSLSLVWFASLYRLSSCRSASCVLARVPLTGKLIFAFTGDLGIGFTGVGIAVVLAVVVFGVVVAVVIAVVLEAVGVVCVEEREARKAAKGACDFVNCKASSSKIL